MGAGGGRLDAIGLWCEQQRAPFESCLILPHHVGVRDDCGSFADALMVNWRSSEVSSHTAELSNRGGTTHGRPPQ